MTLSAAMCSKCFHHLFARAVQRLGHLSRRHWPGNCCGREPCERRDADLQTGNRVGGAEIRGRSPNSQRPAACHRQIAADAVSRADERFAAAAVSRPTALRRHSVALARLSTDKSRATVDVAKTQKREFVACVGLRVQLEYSLSGHG